MFEKLIRAAIEHRWLVLLAVFGMAAIGVFNYQKLPIDAVPDITNVQVQINTQAPGYSPLETEQRVTYPIETVMAGLPNLEQTRSLSRYGLSQVTVIFKDGTDIYFARQLVNERIQEARDKLPSGITPAMGPISTGLGEIYLWTVEAKDGAKKPDGQPYTATDLREIQDWIIKPQLRNVPGVTEINSIGGFAKEYQISPIPERLASLGVTLQDIVTALDRNNGNVGAGYIEKRGEQYLIRAPGQVKTLEDIGNVILSSAGGVPIRVRDVAEVGIGRELRTGAATDNGREVVLGTVFMLIGQNSRTVSQAVDKKMIEINRNLPKGVQVVTVYDRTTLVDKAIATVAKNLLEGAILVIAVLFYFLGNLRAALITAAVIPLSMMFTLTGMVQYKVSANLMSLGALDFGIIVDGAVIVIENIMHRLAERGEGMNEKERKTLITQAANEVGRPTLFSMLIIIAAHIPIFALQRHEGRIFQPMALSVTAALIGALIFSLTLVPLLAYWMLRRGLPHEDNRVVKSLKNLYEPALDCALGHRRQVVVAAVAAFVLAIMAAARLGSEFLPELNEGTFWVNWDMPASISQQEASQVLRKARTQLLKIPEVRTVVSKAGQPEDGTDPKTLSMAEVFVDVKPVEEWRKGLTREQLIEEMDFQLTRIPGIDPAFSQPIRDNVLESISQIKGQIVVKVAGDDLAELRRTTEALQREFRQVAGVQRAEIDRLGELPQILVDIDRERASRLGLNVTDIQDVIETALAGRAVTDIWEGERRFSVAIRLPKDQRTLEQLPNTTIPIPGGGYTSLASVTNIRQAGGAMNIAREAGRRTMAIGVFIKGRDMGSVVADMKARVRQNVLIPANYTLNWSGEFENQERAMQRLSVVVPISMLLIFVLLFNAFASVKSALLILVNVPLALIGGFIALWVFRIPLSVSAAIGFIALSGQAVLNGVVMLTVFQQLRNAGMSVVDAVKQGSEQRLRTVLMTALLAALGLLPMALSHDIGSETQRPLAMVVIGGLVTATLLTLIVLPVLYVAWFSPRSGGGGATTKA